MNNVTKKDEKRTCFVVMGFGKKTDFETGRVLDLDKSYKNMIKPAVTAAGLECVRADEIVHSGLIDVPMYEQLLNADVVVADLSTSNKNALYELGIRHALRPFTTVVIAEDGIKTFPFDINHVVIRQYHHLGEDIGFDEVMRFREQLTSAIQEIVNKNPPNNDSPVYTFLNGLTPPAIVKAFKAEMREVKASDTQHPSTHSVLMQQVDAAQKAGDWLTAKTLLATIHGMMTEDPSKKHEDPYIIQRLALCTYKSKHPTEEASLLEAHSILQRLDPGTSNDTETLGLWGAIHKRLEQLTNNPAHLDEAVRAYERGFFIRNDYYNGINYAYLLNVRASKTTDRAEAIADFIGAMRARKEVIQICLDWLRDNPMPEENDYGGQTLKAYLANWYWVKATLGEAYIGIGEDGKGQEELNEAFHKAPEPWMQASTVDQIGKLKALLAQSPLRYISK